MKPAALWLAAIAIALLMAYTGDDTDIEERTAAAARDVERTGLVAAKD